ncbi:MAG: class I SAM-dependent methyltransferase [Lachnospiraceae bacterium]|nr:class I SAM-dependent methyltransferase [Lachnospiraceae bacterium]
MYKEENIISTWIADMYEMHETETDDVEFALSFIGEAPKKVLEIACGSGRFLIPMAKAGHIVTGIDFDEHMLKKISKKATGMNNITWHKADVIHDEWGKGYDCVILGANFLLNIVSDMDYEKAQELLIQKSADALLTGGHIFIDYGYTRFPEAWFNNPNDNVIWQGTDSNGNTGRMLLRENKFDRENSMIRFIRRFELTLNDGRTITQEILDMKYFVTPEKVHKWLTNAGFVVENEYGDYKYNPISESTSRAILWARKL